MNKSFLSVKDMTYIALGAALLSICALITVPSAVPFTLQTFALFFLATFLTTKQSFLCLFTYVLLGAIGLPVFAGGKGGLGVLFGVTGGYILGFFFVPLCLMFTKKLQKNKRVLTLLLSFCAQAFVYLFGTLFFTYLYTKTKGDMSFYTALLTCVVPFILPDIIKLVIGVLLGERLQKVFSLQTK